MDKKYIPLYLEEVFDFKELNIYNFLFSKKLPRKLKKKRAKMFKNKTLLPNIS